MQPDTTIKKTVELLLRMFLLIILFSTPLIIKFIIRKTECSAFDIWYLISVNLLAQIWFICYTLRRTRRKRETDKIKKNKNRAVPVLPFVITGTITLIFLIDPLQQLIPVSHWLEGFFRKMTEIKILPAIYIILLGPIPEEVIFRGIILHGFLKHYQPLKAILLSSLLFGIVHFFSNQLVSAFICGCFTGFVYWQTGSLFLCIIVHSLNNFSWLISAHLLGFGKSMETGINSTPLFLGLYLTAAVLFFFSLLSIYRKNTVIDPG